MTTTELRSSRYPSFVIVLTCIPFRSFTASSLQTPTTNYLKPKGYPPPCIQYATSYPYPYSLPSLPWHTHTKSTKRRRTKGRIRASQGSRSCSIKWMHHPYMLLYTTSRQRSSSMACSRMTAPQWKPYTKMSRRWPLASSTLPNATSWRTSRQTWPSAPKKLAMGLHRPPHRLPLFLGYHQPL